MPRTNASAMALYDSTENSSVTFTLIPAAIASSMAGTPASVPGILIIRLGRSTRSQYSCACLRVASVSCAKAGSTSSETKPSAWSASSQTGRSTSHASCTSRIAISS